MLLTNQKNTKTPEAKNFTEFNGNSKHESRYRRILIWTKLYGDLGKLYKIKKYNVTCMNAR